MGTDYTDGIYPNPVSDVAIISFMLETSGSVSVQVFDLSGRLITTIANGLFPAGHYQMEWDASNVIEGLYIIRMSAGEYLLTEKILVAR